jgi:hypothetical protein
VAVRPVAEGAQDAAGLDRRPFRGRRSLPPSPGRGARRRATRDDRRVSRTSHGLLRAYEITVRRVPTDNGTHTARVLPGRHAGARVPAHPDAPYTPWTNGNPESMVNIALNGWA